MAKPPRNPKFGLTLFTLRAFLDQGRGALKSENLATLLRAALGRTDLRYL